MSLSTPASAAAVTCCSAIETSRCRWQWSSIQRTMGRTLPPRSPAEPAPRGLPGQARDLCGAKTSASDAETRQTVGVGRSNVGGEVELRLLGAVELIGREGPLHLGGPHQRAIVAALALRAGRTVTTHDLIDGLW